MIRRPPRSTQSRSSAASDVYKRQDPVWLPWLPTDRGFDAGWRVIGFVAFGLVSGGDPCDPSNDVAARWGRFDEVVDGGGLRSASVEGCGEGVEGVSPVLVGEMYAFSAVGFWVGEV